MTYNDVRLEKDGAVVMYLAPTSQITPVLKNESDPRPRLKRFPVAIDLRRYWHEVDVQGTFEHSDNLPEDHRAALQDLFGREQVTAEMQLRRIFQYVFTYGGAFELYTPHILYIAPGTEWTIEHPALGDRPIVMQTAVIEEIRAWWVSGRERIDWTIKCLAGGGRVREDPEEEDDSWLDRMWDWLFGPSEPSD